MATPSVIPIDANRDNSVRLGRVTREKRQLWYQLTVLQQPERARACGAGTKGEFWFQGPDRYSPLTYDRSQQ